MDKILTKKYDKLVSDAPELIKVLPWGVDYEVDVSAWPLLLAGRLSLPVFRLSASPISLVGGHA